MDVPPIGRAAPERSEPPPPPVPSPDTSRRLANIEAGLAELGERLDALAAVLDASVRTAVASEVRSASADLRHTVSELGRLLVRDLGRLSKILTEHRNSIVADLRAPAPGSPARPPGTPNPSPAPSTGDEGAVVIGEGGDGAGPGDDGDGPDGTDDAHPDGADSGGRQRRPLLRRRQA